MSTKNRSAGAPVFDDDWGIDTWLAIGAGTGVALMAAVWIIDRAERARDAEPSSILFAPRFGPFRSGRTHPPLSSRRDYTSPSERIYPPRRPF